MKHHRCEKPFYVSIGMDFCQPSQECSPLCFVVLTTCLSEFTETLGKQPLSRSVWWIRVNTRLDGIIRWGKTSSIFFNRSSRIAIAKTIYKMHVAIFHVRKYERRISISVHYQTLTKKPQWVLDNLEGNAFHSRVFSMQLREQTYELISFPADQLRAIILGHKGSPQFSISIISQTVQLWI